MNRIKPITYEAVKSHAARFWSNVQKGKKNECWPYLCRKRTGYGRISIDNISYPAHRVAWVLVNRQDLPPHLLACHRCDNRACVNPAHLFLGTHQDNTQDMMKKGRNRSNPNPGLHLPKFTDKQVITMRKDYALGKSAHQLAVEYDTTHGNVSKIVRGLTYRWVGGPRTFLGNDWRRWRESRKT